MAADKVQVEFQALSVGAKHHSPRLYIFVKKAIPLLYLSQAGSLTLASKDAGRLKNNQPVTQLTKGREYAFMNEHPTIRHRMKNAFMHQHSLRKRG